MLKIDLSNKLRSLSISLSKSQLYLHLFFGLTTFLTINFMGYYFGSFDQSSHIPFLKKFADPSLYPNDSFIDLRFYHYSYFWLLFIPFYKLGVLEISLFITYILAVYLTFWSLWNFSKKLFNNPLTSFLTVIVSLLPHLGFSAFPLFEFSLLNRTFVLPFLIIAINLYLDKKYTKSFLLLGILYNLHIVSVNFVLFMFIFNFLVNKEQRNYLKLIRYCLIFTIPALPVLFWKSGISTADIRPNYEWFSIISQGALNHLFYFLGTNIYINLLTLGGLSSLVLFLIAKKGLKQEEKTNTLSTFMSALILLIVTQVLATYIFPSTILIQSQIVRAGVFINLFSLLYFLNYLVHLYETKKISGKEFTLLVLATIFSVIPIIALVVWSTRKKLNLNYWFLLSPIIIVSSFLTLGAFAYSLPSWKPGISVYPKKTSYYDIQIWAKTNTEKNAVFITPPSKDWFFETDWRVGSERSTLVSFFDLVEIGVVPEGLPSWKERFAKIAPNALARFNGNIFINSRLAKHSYYSLSNTDFKQIAQQYNISYLVVEKPHYYNFPKVYENTDYLIYKMK